MPFPIVDGWIGSEARRHTSTVVDDKDEGPAEAGRWWVRPSLTLAGLFLMYLVLAKLGFQII